MIFAETAKPRGWLAGSISPVLQLLLQYGPIARFAAFKLDPSLIQVKPNARFKHEQITGRRHPQYNGAPTQPDWTKLDYQFRLRALTRYMSSALPCLALVLIGRMAVW